MKEKKEKGRKENKSKRDGNKGKRWIEEKMKRN